MSLESLLGNTQHPIRPRVAFSLLEVFVLVVIIGLLALLVVPCLEAAKGRSRQSACLERLGNIAHASSIHGETEPGNPAIPVHPLFHQQVTYHPWFIGAYEWGGKSGVGRPDFVSGQIPPLGSKYGTLAGFGPATRPLNRILYPEGFRNHGNPLQRIGASIDTELQLDAFRCPGDDGPPLGEAGTGIGPHCPDWIRNSGQTSFDHFGTSFAANIFMIGASGGGCVLSNSPYLRPLSDVPTPNKTILFEENIGRWAWAARRERDSCSYLGPGVDPGPTKSIRGWHGKHWTYNRCFADGHADTQKILLEGTSDSQGYYLHYTNERLSYYPPFNCHSELPDESTQAAREQAYQCIIIRGPGWAKDTMPADFVDPVLNWPGDGRPSFEDCVQQGD